MKGRYVNKKQSKNKKIIGVALGVFLTLILAMVVLVVVYYNATLNKINHVSVPEIAYTFPTELPTEVPTEEASVEVQELTPPEVTEQHIPSSADYINILLVGQASRDGEPERFADTSILCTINTYTKTLTMTSLLRDTLIKMPDYKGHYGGNIKLTTIYHLGYLYGDGIAGSMELMNLTLFNNFGIEVDYNVEVDFDAFIRVVDALGGIDLELTEAEAKYLNDDDFWVHQDYDPGFAHLNGMSALCYARMRKAEGDSGSDIIRTSRQRKVIEAIIGKLKGISLSEVRDIIDDILPLVSTSMTNAEITEYLLKLLPMLQDLKIETGGTCPVSYSGGLLDIYSDGVMHSVLYFDQANTIKAMREITKGEKIQ